MRKLRPHGTPLVFSTNLLSEGKRDASSKSPEVEDFEVIRSAARWERDVPAQELWERVREGAATRLTNIFDDLERTALGKVWAPTGGGTASLGAYLRVGVEIITDVDGNPRAHFDDVDLGRVDLSITALELFDASGQPLPGAIADLKRRVAEASRSVLCVGLGRAFPPANPKHWLQVNNIHVPQGA